jgi:MerR family transcriptional regulator, copper efflux regulator
MLTNLRIAEVADQAGITTSTVRYYERIGVLPPAPRGPNGYRIYREQTVERLAFINRAKQLGCSLSEIADLSTAWDGGTCGPVQDRLRALVAEKIATARVETFELITLTAELRRAAASLERHRPTGACDARCGCVSEPLDAAPIISDVALGATCADGAATEVACSLGAARMRDRFEMWHELLGDETESTGAVTARRAIQGGVRLEFATGVDVAELARLATAEHDCCRFLCFAITIDHRGVGVDITGPADASAVITSVFGAPT